MTVRAGSAGGDADLARHGRPSPRAVSSDVRRHNLSLIARILASSGPRSRSRLAEEAGLTRGAVTALASVLIDAGIVRELDADHVSAGSAKGRPNVPLQLASDRIALLALQLDADRATAMLTTLAGDVLLRVEDRHRRPMGDPEPVLDVLASVLARAIDGSTALGRDIVDLTVITFAPVGGEPAVVLADSDLGWGQVDVLGGLHRRVPGMPAARLTSDGPVAASAELELLGDVRDALYLKSNSGIGGAAITDGRLLLGSQGMAGEFGHIAIDPGGAPCACGQVGCLVTVAGPDVLLETAGLRAELERDGLGSALTEFVRRIHDGEPRAVAAWTGGVEWIARALHILTISFDPEVIILGGYWSPLADTVADRFREGGPRALGEEMYAPPRVIAGRLGDDAALLGAIRNARDLALADPLQLAR